MRIGQTAAVAKDLKQDQKNSAPAVSAAQMSDAEMDKVTAGRIPGIPGQGVFTADDASNGREKGSPPIAQSGIVAGQGTLTAHSK